MRVDEVMTKRVVTVPPDLPLRHLARVLLANDVSGVPVVDDGRVVGVISESDIVAIEKDRPLARRRLFRRAGGVRVQRVVADAMTSPAVTIEPWITIGTAATQMAEHEVNRLPVVRGRSLVGIVARADLVRAFARSDDAIRREIEHEVLPTLEPRGAIDVTVERGEVSLGFADAADATESAARAVRRVPGVVAVRVTPRQAHAPR